MSVAGLERDRVRQLSATEGMEKTMAWDSMGWSSFSRAGRAWLATATAVLALALAFALAPAGAKADFGTLPGQAGFDGTVLDAAGNAYSQAGGHPAAAATTLKFNETTTAFGVRIPDGTPRQIEVALPPGFVGNPQAAPTCPLAKFFAANEEGESVAINSTCPADTQVGVAMARMAVLGPGFLVNRFSPVYNLEPSADEPALFGFRFVSQDVLMHAKVRTGDDYGITAVIPNISQAVPVYQTEVALWGVPADSSHDPLRGPCLSVNGNSLGTCRSEAPRRPFLTNPTSCTPDGVGVLTGLHMESWQGASFDSSFVSHDNGNAPLGPKGCDVLPFTPELSVTPTSHAAASPTGLRVRIDVPQPENPDGVAEANLKDTTVTLPQGMTVASSAADGLGACSAAEIDLAGPGPAHCPDSAKIGTVSVETPLLGQPLEGSVYLAKPHENKFGSLLAMYLVVEGRGVVLKLPGKVEADPDSGRLTASFEENPQLPFSSVTVDLFGGSRASLVTPKTCGTFVASGEFTPWSGTAPVVSTDSFQITSGPNSSGCPGSEASRPFEPRLQAGLVSPISGSRSAFNLKLSRSDGDRELTAVDVVPPPGLTAVLKGVPYCPEAALDAARARDGKAESAAPSCPAASQVGTATTGVGVGSTPYYVKTGRVYLAGPYKGAPLSLAVVAPAVAGPFDLGTVVVRAAIQVDPTTARLKVASDPLPRILQGIPLNIRDVMVAIDRPSFTVAPTNCEPMSVDAVAHGSEGATTGLANPFQVGACKALDFSPKLALRLFGPTKRGQNPRLRAVLTQPEGQANIARVSVALPHSEFLDQSHIKTICTRVQYAAKACPPGSVYGYAKAYSPLLDKPLQGPVYLRSSSNPLPDLVASLDGQVHIDLAGRIDSVRGGIRNTFETVPDAPVSKFVLTMQGGKKSLLVNSRDLCKSVNRATVQIDAQNGKTADARPVLANGCGKKAKRKGAARP